MHAGKQSSSSLINTTEILKRETAILISTALQQERRDIRILGPNMGDGLFTDMEWISLLEKKFQGQTQEEPLFCQCAAHMCEQEELDSSLMKIETPLDDNSGGIVADKLINFIAKRAGIKLEVIWIKSGSHEYVAVHPAQCSTEPKIFVEYVTS